MHRVAPVAVAALALFAASCVGPFTRFCPPTPCPDAGGTTTATARPCPKCPVCPECPKVSDAPAPAPQPEPVHQPAPAPAVDVSQCVPGQAILNATLWVQTSAEFRASAIQTFAAAKRSLDEALADKNWVAATEDNAETSVRQTPAIIVDVDETVIDNTRFQARAIREGKTYDSEIWEQWTAEAGAAAITGAAEFLAYARDKGVTVFYVTNRNAGEEDDTRENLRRLGFPVSDDPDTVLTRAERTAWHDRDKSLRREWVGSLHRILLLLGDDLNDFVSVENKTVEERDEIVARTKSWWGTKWFMLPNPIYGSWERAITAGEGSPCEQQRKKMEALRD